MHSIPCKLAGNGITSVTGNTIALTLSTSKDRYTALKSFANPGDTETGLVVQALTFKFTALVVLKVALMARPSAVASDTIWSLPAPIAKLLV